MLTVLALVKCEQLLDLLTQPGECAALGSLRQTEPTPVGRTGYWSARSPLRQEARTAGRDERFARQKGPANGSLGSELGEDADAPHPLFSLNFRDGFCGPRPKVDWCWRWIR
jgi:hypothetical protein